MAQNVGRQVSADLVALPWSSVWTKPGGPAGHQMSTHTRAGALEILTCSVPMQAPLPPGHSTFEIRGWMSHRNACSCLSRYQVSIATPLCSGQLSPMPTHTARPGPVLSRLEFLVSASSRINSNFYNFRERSFVHENIQYHRHETTHHVSAQHEEPPLQHLLTAGHSKLGCVYGVYAP